MLLCCIKLVYVLRGIEVAGADIVAIATSPVPPPGLETDALFAKLVNGKPIVAPETLPNVDATKKWLLVEII
jgi:hypothetical protein